jgi:uncharacterized protein YbjT (DUF2867 family)
MNTTQTKNALVVGATGLIGNKLVELLLHSNHYKEVRVLVRKATGITHPRLVEIKYHFNQPDATQVVGDDVFCCLGTTIKQAGSKEAFIKVDYEYPLQIARFAIQNGATQYLIVTAMGASAESVFFYNRVKGEVEEDLQALNFQSLHIFRPSLLLGDRKEKRLGEKIGESVLSFLKPIMRGPLEKYQGIQASKVAESMLKQAQSNRKGVHIHESVELQHS